MATDLTTLALEVAAGISGKTQKKVDLSTPTENISGGAGKSLSFGTGAGEADQVWHDRRILAAEGTDNLDLAGVLKNAYGAVVTFAKVKAIFVFNRSDEVGVHAEHAVATDAKLTIGAAAAANEFIGPFSAAGNSIDLEAGNPFLIANLGTGWAVVADGEDSEDLLKIYNNDADDQALYDIVIAGVSA